MLNYGIVEIYKGQIKVRVLVHNGKKGQAGATPSKDLPNAVVNSRDKEAYKDGDTVVVGYVYNDTSHPVILFPYGEKEPTAGQRTEKLLSVIDTAKLPQNTNIGKVKGSEIENLRGLNYLLVEKIKQIEKANSKLGSTVGDIASILDTINGEVI